MIDLFQTRVSTELNRFVRKVTAWGTVGIAWTVITGVYGMNVVGIPGLESPGGSPRSSRPWSLSAAYWRCSSVGTAGCERATPREARKTHDGGLSPVNRTATCSIATDASDVVNSATAGGRC
jgi:hypothetical protein